MKYDKIKLSFHYLNIFIMEWNKNKKVVLSNIILLKWKKSVRCNEIECISLYIQLNNSSNIILVLLYYITFFLYQFEHSPSKKKVLKDIKLLLSYCLESYSFSLDSMLDLCIYKSLFP